MVKPDRYFKEGFMQSQLMNRRDFLKLVFSVAGVFVLARFKGFKGWLKLGKRKISDSSLKEARFYKSGNHLAG